MLLSTSLFLAFAVFLCQAKQISLDDDDSSSDNLVQPYIYESEVQKAIDDLAESLRELDPYVIREVKAQYENEYFNAEFEAKDILLRGFSRFRVAQIKNQVTILPPGLRTNFRINFEELHLVVPYYYLDALAVFVPFYGSGSVNLVVRNANGGAEASVQLGKQIKLRSLDIKLNITSTNLYVSGILNNEPLSKIVSTSTTECFSEFINLYNDKLGKTLGKLLIPTLNELLNPPKAPKPTEPPVSESSESSESSEETEESSTAPNVETTEEAIQAALDDIGRSKLKLNLGPSKVNLNVNV